MDKPILPRELSEYSGYTWNECRKEVIANYHVNESKIEEILIRFGIEVENKLGERKTILDQALADLKKLFLGE